VSPFRMRSASCRETPEVRFSVTPGFFLRKPSSSRIGPASESA
jgi:hypothetical protein